MTKTKNTMDDLRDHLFATLEALRDDENPMEPARAKAINQTAQTLINTGKMEVAFIDATGVVPAGRFFAGIDAGEPNDRPALTAASTRGQKSLPPGQRR
jgi:hypothetical protein